MFIIFFYLFLFLFLVQKLSDLACLALDRLQDSSEHFELPSEASSILSNRLSVINLALCVFLSATVITNRE